MVEIICTVLLIALIAALFLVISLIVCFVLTIADELKRKRTDKALRKKDMQTYNNCRAVYSYRH